MRQTSTRSIRLLTCLLVLLPALAPLTILAQGIRYVKPIATGSGNGNSWADASSDLQLMINITPATGKVWVAGGLYKPTSTTDRSSSFSMKQGVAIYGGFRGGETSLTQRPPISIDNPSSTTLSGDIGTVDNADNSYHVIRNPSSLSLNQTAILDGFVIADGNASGSSFPDNAGGGIYNDGRGSGKSSSPLIQNCMFRNNRASSLGGAMLNDGFQGESSPRVLNSSFESNTASSGGVMYNAGSQGKSNPELINCSFRNNIATSLGGVMYNDGYNGGQSVPTVLNCSFRSNSAPQGGVCYRFDATVLLYSCVLFMNGGASTFASNNASTVNMQYSLVEPTVTNYAAGGNNITTTTSPFENDTKLRDGSPAIDAGREANGFTYPSTDLAGNPRVTGTFIDMGAFERCLPVSRLYVNPAAAGIRDGKTWATALATLQDALNYGCSGNLTEIWVAGGLYKPTTTGIRDYTFTLKDGVFIYGGFIGTETDPNQRPAITLTTPSSTTLSGDIGTVGIPTDNSYHVLTNPAGSQIVLLDGFVITGGYADDSGGGGGGLYNNGAGVGKVSNPFVRNCLFVNNYGNQGGAIYNDGSSGGQSSPILSDCQFLNNRSVNHGGAIYNKDRCIATLTNCLFRTNRAANGNGGAIYNDAISTRSNSISLVNCAFESNTAYLGGGAIYTDGNASTPSTPVLTNCSFQGNNTDVAPTFPSTVLGVNTSTAVTIQLVNCIVFNNGLVGSFSSHGTGNAYTARYCLFDAYVTGYTNVAGNQSTTTSPFLSTTSTMPNSHVAPLFADRSDPATSGVTLTTTDLGRNPRIVAVRADIGAYELPCRITTLLVDANAQGRATGDTGADAFPNLQSALAYSCPFNEIKVASGIYYPTAGNDRTVSFVMKPGVAIYGGFTTNFATTIPLSTTLSGNIGSPTSTSDNSFHVIKNGPGLTNSAILDGFTIADGNANSTTDNIDLLGGGMLNSSRNAPVTGSCSPLIRTCLFVNNRADDGGAIYNYAEPTTEAGGAGTGDTSPKIINTQFLTNTASQRGGAVFNRADAGIANPTFMNCSFQDNSAPTAGGGVFTSSSNGVSFVNCSFQRNTSSYGGAVYAGVNLNTFTNTIVWDNGPIRSRGIYGTNLSVRYSLIDAAITDYTSQTGNVAITTPPFASTATTRITVNSAALNMGDPSTTTATAGLTDIIGNPRFGGRIDMGAYEIIEIVTLKTGFWTDPTVWSIGRLPVSGEQARLKHAVTIPVNYSATAGRLLYDAGGRLIYGSGGRLQIGQ